MKFTFEDKEILFYQQDYLYNFYAVIDGVAYTFDPYYQGVGEGTKDFDVRSFPLAESVAPSFNNPEAFFDRFNSFIRGQFGDSITHYGEIVLREVCDSDEEHEWLKTEWQDRVTDSQFYYQDNFRFCVIGDSETEKEYKDALRKGCCGFEDWEIESPFSGKKMKLGFNWGH